MPYITKKKFEGYLKSCELYIETMKSIKPLPKIKHPKLTKEQELTRIGWVLRSDIDSRNDNNKSYHESVGKEIKRGNKNLDDLIKSKKESVFGLIHYNKIHTWNCGNVNFKEFVKYLKSSVNTYKLFLKQKN